MLMDAKTSMNINLLNTAKPNERQTCRYKIKLDSDEHLYGGHGRLDHNTEFSTEAHGFNGRQNSIKESD
ncbi:hypothetical protein NQZ68_012995 [Dissostichus eleginoides]|nr:hypothetical protein NQZ68_012995 [Dissostichus eleginoides]